VNQHVRLWDTDFTLLWDSATGSGTAEEFARSRGEGFVFYTIDHDHGMRWSGRLEVDGDGTVSQHDEYEYLEHLLVPVNPFLPYEPGETSQEFDQRAERARLRGDFGLDWMLNGFPGKPTEPFDPSRSLRLHGWMYPDWRPQLALEGSR
jgi:hypothetical protein